MIRFLLVAPLMLAALLTSCAYPNQFRNVSADSPHAVLTGSGVKVTHLNDQPASFWRCSERFRIPPGPTTLRTVAGHWNVHEYPLLWFSAQSGESYFLQRQQSDGSDSVSYTHLTLP